MRCQGLGKKIIHPHALVPPISSSQITDASIYQITSHPNVSAISPQISFCLHFNNILDVVVMSLIS